MVSTNSGEAPRTPAMTFDGEQQSEREREASSAVGGRREELGVRFYRGEAGRANKGRSGSSRLSSTVSVHGVMGKKRRH
jgi:hypothetical protein